MKPRPIHFTIYTAVNKYLLHKCSLFRYFQISICDTTHQYKVFWPSLASYYGKNVNYSFHCFHTNKP